METALPIKFAATVVEALGRDPVRPPQFEGIEALPKRVKVMPADVALMKGPEFSKFMVSEMKKWTQVIKEANIKPE